MQINTNSIRFHRESTQKQTVSPTPKQQGDTVKLGSTQQQFSFVTPHEMSAVFGKGRAVLTEGAAYHREQAYQILDGLLEARDQTAGLLPMHVRTENGKMVAADHAASGIDMGRQTAGLVMAARVAEASGDQARADKYIQAAEQNYQAGKELLAEGNIFVHMRNFNDDGSVASTNLGEPGRSAEGQDNVTRVNPRAYAFRAAGELYQATGEEQYKADFSRYFDAWVKDFHDPEHGGFFVHSNLERAGDHTTRDSISGRDGAAVEYDGSAGVKGNDGTVYGLSSVLLTANEVLGTPRTQKLVKESMDIILDRFEQADGMLWENYTADFKPIAVGWQSQPRENGQPSHVAIGGHTAMAPQQIIEGARQLKSQGAISQEEYDRYIDRSLSLFQDFTESGAVDWESGAVHNAMRVEEPDRDKRWIENWGDAGWQQAELLQSLVRFKQEGRLEQLKGPAGKDGFDLLKSAQGHYEENYSMPTEYSFDGFANPDPYHRPQVAQYFQEALG